MKKIFFLTAAAIFFAMTLRPAFAEVQKVTIDDAIKIALEQNLELQAKRKDYEIYSQEVKIANALKNPQFQSNFLLGKVNTGNSSQFGIALPLEIAKRGVRKKAAEAKLTSVENEIRLAEHNVKINVMEEYFNVLYMKSLLKIAKDRAEIFKEMSEIAHSKPANSLNYKIDILQSDIKHKKSLVQLNAAKANLLRAQFDLNRAMDVEDDIILYDTLEKSLFGDVSILDIELPPYETIEAIAFKYSYSIKIVDSDIEKLSRDIKVQKHKVIPDVTIASGYAYQTAKQTGKESLPGAFIGVFADIPVLYTYRPEVKKAAFIYEKAKMDKKSYENKLKLALKTNYNDFIYTKENMEYYKDILDYSKEILKMSTERYRNGETPLLGLMWNENAYQETMHEYLDMMNTYYSAYLSLMHNMGHDFILDDDII